VETGIRTYIDMKTVIDHKRAEDIEKDMEDFLSDWPEGEHKNKVRFLTSLNPDFWLSYKEYLREHAKCMIETIITLFANLPASPSQPS
jgi:hypothetical protein